jgi:nucleoside-diphosphate-sugar epimerase
MRVFLAGATGAIGRRLVPLLKSAGHQVTGMTRSPARADALRAMGAEPAIADALDADAVRQALAAAHPEAVIHELTALPQRIDPRRIGPDFELNDRLRSEGTRILVAAAQQAGARRIIAQSIAFMYARGSGGTLHTETDELLDEGAPKAFERTAGAVRELERTTLGAGGVVLRYGYFYGPGSAISREGSMGQDLVRRRMPIVGSGGGVWSFIHIDDAARATVAALTRGRSGAYNIVDDEPAPVAQWLPALAQALGAPRPLRVPAFIARLAAGAYGVEVMTKAQGASNRLAKSELGWEPQHASWREGFRDALG